MIARTHHRLAPSSAARWRRCPGSLDLIAKMGPEDREPQSPAAREGTVAMALIEELLKHAGHMEQAALALLERTQPDPPVDPMELTADICKFANDAADFLFQLSARAAAGRPAWGVEEAVAIPRAGTEGHADFWVLQPDRLTVVDVKHGAGVPVRARENAQLTLYASGLADRLELDPGFPVEIVVYQPRCVETGVHKWTTTVGWVHDAAEDMARFVLENPDLIQTGDHCRFCPAALICPARRAEVEEAAAFLEAPEDDAELARLLEVADRVKTVLEKAKAKAVARLQAGGFQGYGWALKEGRGAFVWKASAKEAALRQYGDAALTAPELLTPAQLRDTLPDGDVFFREHAVRRPGYPTLTRGEGPPAQINWPKGHTDQ